ncbi:AraC family transcriptional regulator [Bradyrhizobium ontarionense]|uniref:AraC family transcriptional regulator n=1 Tax=Bradyrhizobium ontarionense TaxID=2898149 RepID=A0ABY3RIJ0_9BRAD|nr:AraC family transcriptional regulator [Bradyrhizobium sp. A19]UFZ07069.1 AraC family transcriptional regulator [Bradyrhizobium sp. A19]
MGSNADPRIRRDADRYTGGVLLSSADRHWRGLSAELRCHPAGEIPAYVASVTQIAILVRGTSVVDRRAGGVRQRIVGLRGTIGLCPMGVHEDYTYVSKPIDEMLHIYLAPSAFASLARHTSRDFNAASVRYEAGFNDRLIEVIAAEVLGELRFETSCGDLMVEALADALAVRLLNNYSSLSVDPFRTRRGSKGLDPRRLQRVIDYIQTNLTKEITVEELAAAAALSRFHFSRMFKSTTGQSPSRFIGLLRLELAKTLLTAGRSMSEVARDCGFSSESNFVRSFRRATGVPPGRYRDSTRK